MSKKAKHINWEKLPDEKLMKMRVRDLHLTIEGTALETMINTLYGELSDRGIIFHPPCYLADEWLNPDKEPIIGIPFYLAHPRLKQIEQEMMYEVEGGTDVTCMQLLRHEAGHSLNYAYEFYKKTRWRELFGPFSMRYSDFYYSQPYSKRFVRHLGDNYAQAHPDEDFAETFAVWLTPGNSWREKYKDWPALKKLSYVDNLMKNVSGKPPIQKSEGKPPWSASRMTSTLESYYERKRKFLKHEFKGFYDEPLLSLFPAQQSSQSNIKASKILRQYRQELSNNISKCTGHRKYDIHQLLDKLIQRCDSLKLYGKEKDITAIAVLVTTIVGNTLRIRKNGEKK